MLGKFITASLILTQTFFALFLFSLPLGIQSVVYDSLAFQSGLFSPYLAGMVHIADVFLLLSAFFFGAYLIKTHQTGMITWGNTYILWAFAALFASMALPLFWVAEPILIIKDMTRFIEYFVMYFLFLNIPAPFESWLKIIIASGVMQALIGIAQFVAQGSIGLSFLGEMQITSQTIAPATFIWKEGEYLRAFGTTAHATILSGVLIVSFFVTLILMYCKELNQELNKKTTTIFIIVLTLIFLGIFVTFTRPAWMALIIGFITLAVWYHPSWLTKNAIGTLGIGLVIIGIFFGPLAWQRVISPENTFSQKMVLYDIGARMLVENPLGVGSSHYVYHMQNFTPHILAPWEEVPIPNTFVLSLVENGFVGFAIYIALWVVLIYLTWKHRHHEMTNIILAMLASVFILANTYSYFSTIITGEFYWWMVVAIVGYTTNMYTKHKQVL